MRVRGVGCDVGAVARVRLGRLRARRLLYFAAVHIRIELVDYAIRPRVFLGCSESSDFSSHFMNGPYKALVV